MCVDSSNHRVPIIEVIDDRADDSPSYAVTPLFRSPPFQYVKEVIDFVCQILEVETLSTLEALVSRLHYGIDHARERRRLLVTLISLYLRLPRLRLNIELKKVTGVLGRDQSSFSQPRHLSAIGSRSLHAIVIPMFPDLNSCRHIAQYAIYSPPSQIVLTKSCGCYQGERSALVLHHHSSLGRDLDLSMVRLVDPKYMNRKFLLEIGVHYARTFSCYFPDAIYFDALYLRSCLYVCDLAGLQRIA